MVSNNFKLKLLFYPNFQSSFAYIRSFFLFKMVKLRMLAQIDIVSGNVYSNIYID